METRLVRLKSNFNTIITIRNNVRSIFENLHIKIQKLKALYTDFIRDNQTQMFIFGLDSFHFQGKLLDIEYDDMKRLFLVINNRMYCEYFKLHKMVGEYIAEHIKDKRVQDLAKAGSSMYPVYKDLEPFREYRFELVQDIHENILNLLTAMESFVLNRQNELEMHKTKKDLGLNIDNFITSFNYDIFVVREKIAVFVTYIEFFHQMHTKYLKRFSNKIQLMYSHINKDVRLDESVHMSADRKHEMLQELASESADSEGMRELRQSIDLSTSTHSSAVGNHHKTPTTTVPQPLARKLSKGRSLLGGLCRKESASQAAVELLPVLQEQEVQKLFLEIENARPDASARLPLRIECDVEPNDSSITTQDTSMEVNTSGGGTTNNHGSETSLCSGNIGFEDIFVEQRHQRQDSNSSWLEPEAEASLDSDDALEVNHRLNAIVEEVQRRVETEENIQLTLRSLSS